MFVNLHCTVLQLHDLRSVLCSRNIEVYSGGFQGILTRPPLCIGQAFDFMAFQVYHARIMSVSYLCGYNPYDATSVTDYMLCNVKMAGGEWWIGNNTEGNGLQRRTEE